jgi:DNA-binding IclR family transcriptional regulator
MARRPASSEIRRPRPSHYKPFVPAAAQAAEILECLGNTPKSGLTLTEICDQVHIHKSKGYTLLNTLKKFRYVEKNPRTKTYSLGFGIIALARRALDDIDLRDIAMPHLIELGQETKNTALLGVIDGDQVFVVAKHEGGREIGITIRVGHRFHITHGAHGKAIAAFMSDSARKEILSGKKLWFYGDPQKIDFQRLEMDLAECRRTGFAKDLGDVQTGIHAVSAPIFNASGNVSGCLIVVGTFSGPDAERHGRRLVHHAGKISRKSGAMDHRLIQA